MVPHMASDLVPALISGGVAAIAIITGGVTTWLTLAHQRRLAQEQRTWDVVRELYVDLLMRTDLYRDALTQADAEGPEPRLPEQMQTALLNARVNAYASDGVRDRHRVRVEAYAEYARALVAAGRRHTEFGSKELDDVEIARIFYHHAEEDLAQAIRDELRGMRLRTPPPPRLRPPLGPPSRREKVGYMLSTKARAVVNPIKGLVRRRAVGQK
jgi:hypothetical protein